MEIIEFKTIEQDADEFRRFRIETGITEKDTGEQRMEKIRNKLEEKYGW